MPTPTTASPDRDLALWMLERMGDSVEFLAVLRKARVAGRRDVLDTPDYLARHTGRLKRLYQSDTTEDVGTTTVATAYVDALVARDLLSSREEFLEKAIAAYVERYGSDGLPGADKDIVTAARDEIEGRTRGAFADDFTATLAAAARAELVRGAEREQGSERDR